jgi:hypothetical protein
VQSGSQGCDLSRLNQSGAKQVALPSKLSLKSDRLIAKLISCRPALWEYLSQAFSELAQRVLCHFALIAR